MRVEAHGLEDANADVVVVPVSEGGEPPAGVDERVRALISSGEAGTEFADSTVVRADGFRLAVTGLGKLADADSVRTAVAAAARQTQRVGGTLAYVVNPSLPIGAVEQARAAADGLVLGTYDTRKWLSRDKGDRKPFERLVIVGGDDAATDAAERADARTVRGARERARSRRHTRGGTRARADRRARHGRLRRRRAGRAQRA